MKKLFTYGPALIVIAAVLWGIDGVIRRSLYVLPPLTIVFYEHLVGLVFIAPFALLKLRGEKFTRQEMVALVWVSFFSGLIGTLWFTTALLATNFIPFSVVFLLQKLQPIFAIAAGAVLLKEKITTKYIKWALVALIAAYFVTFPNGLINFDTGKGTIVAALYAVGAAFAWGSSTAVSRYTLLKHSQTVVTGLRFFLTTILALVGVLIMGQFGGLGSVTMPQLLRFAAIALSTGMVALWIYYRGLKNTEAKVSTLLELVFPLTAVVIDIVFYGSILQVTQYGAALVLLYCVWKISRLQNS